MTPIVHSSRAPWAARLRRQAGVGLVTAIFLLVVIAGLGVAAVSLFTSQQAGANLDLEGARAYQAARAGIEWGLYEQLRHGRCAQDPTSFRLPATSVLASFTVTVRCQVIQELRNADDEFVTRWRIRAVACNQADEGRCGEKIPNNPDYVQRRLEVDI